MVVPKTQIVHNGDSDVFVSPKVAHRAADSLYAKLVQRGIRRPDISRTLTHRPAAPLRHVEEGFLMAVTYWEDSPEDEGSSD